MSVARRPPRADRRRRRVEVYREELAWSGSPHPMSEYAAWAKRIAEK